MLKLIQTDNGVFDLAFALNALSDAQTAFATLVYAALFTDAEADSLQEDDRYQRRGWWADPAAGSLLWWYRQQPLSTAIRQSVVDNVYQVLANYSELSAITVTDITGDRNVSTLLLAISADYNQVSVSLHLNPLV